MRPGKSDLAPPIPSPNRRHDRPMASPRILRHAREAVFLLDARRRLVYVNRAWEELTGIPAAEAVGKPCQPHGPTHPGDLAGLLGSFCPPPEATAGRPCGAPTLIVHPGGERLWRRLEFWPFHNARGKVYCLLGLVRPADAPPHAPEAESQRLRVELMEVRGRLLDRHGTDALIGRGPAHRRLLDQVALAAGSRLPALIVGEPGVGKRLVARTIHRRSAGASAPLVPLDCTALAPADLELALFGPAPDGDRADPRLDLPAGSSLVLDHVLDLPRDLQSRLASALGGEVRLLATTAGDVDRARQEDRLRPDLYFALTGLVLRIPPLRERADELPLLAQHLLERANLRGARRRHGFTPEALAALTAYDWPGNLRELARVVDEAHEVGDGDLIDRGDLPAAIRGNLASAYTPPPMPPPVTPLDDLLTQLERRLIEQALLRSRQNKSRAADLLAISRPRLYRRIKELGIPDVPEAPDDPGNHPEGRG